MNHTVKIILVQRYLIFCYSFIQQRKDQHKCEYYIWVLKVTLKLSFASQFSPEVISPIHKYCITCITRFANITLITDFSPSFFLHSEIVIQGKFNWTIAEEVRNHVETQESLKFVFFFHFYSPLVYLLTDCLVSVWFYCLHDSLTWINIILLLQEKIIL